MKVGFVALIGRPNVGKSTLLNNVLDYQLSIITASPQTTRDCIKGIYNDENSQIIFLDTPGIHKPKSKLGEKLNEKSRRILKDADLIIFLLPANDKIGPGDRFILDMISDFSKKIAIITKTDLEENKSKLDEKAQMIKKLGISKVFGISSLNKYGIQSILPEIKKYLPEQKDLLYSDTNLLTDLPLSFLVKEIIRKVAMENVYQEVVHSIGVSLESYQKTMKSVAIDAIIYVEKKSQKIILIGNGGQKIKKIGIESRAKIKKLINLETHLNLVVRVEKNWTKKIDKIKKLGY